METVLARCDATPSPAEGGETWAVISFCGSIVLRRQPDRPTWGTLTVDRAGQAAELAAAIGDEIDLSDVVVPDWGGLTGRGPQRGRGLSDEILAEVARVYRAAYFEGRSVQQAVAEHFTIAPDTATKRTMAARKAGLLDGIGPARR